MLDLSVSGPKALAGNSTTGGGLKARGKEYIPRPAASCSEQSLAVRPGRPGLGLEPTRTWSWGGDTSILQIQSQSPGAACSDLSRSGQATLATAQGCWAWREAISPHRRWLCLLRFLTGYKVCVP